MEMQIGGQIRVLKSGHFEDVSYTKGDVWTIESFYSPLYPNVIRKGRAVRLCMEAENSAYGLEGEYLGMSVPEEQQTYNIY